MSTIQNLKNFIRHGKQARQNHNAHADPTTSVSPVHAHQQPVQKQHQAITDPNVLDHKQLQAGNMQHHEFSAANVDHRNVAAQAGGVAAQKAGEGQKLNQGGAKERKKDYDPTVLERIVAEERESKGKFPRYPGLERFHLVEKMGDGAFSNVYRAKDLTGEFNEVAIKVVRKFEMSTSQVCSDHHP
jgi:serine/threonine-protein kinase RCK2